MIDWEVTDLNRKYSRDLPQGAWPGNTLCFNAPRYQDLVDKADKLLVISIFHKKYFRNLYVITKITKILYYKNLEPYGIYCDSKICTIAQHCICLVKH